MKTSNKRLSDFLKIAKYSVRVKTINMVSWHKSQLLLFYLCLRNSFFFFFWLLRVNNISCRKAGKHRNYHRRNEKMTENSIFCTFSLPSFSLSARVHTQAQVWPSHPLQDIIRREAASLSSEPMPTFGGDHKWEVSSIIFFIYCSKF